MVYAPDSILYCIDHLSESDFADGACAATFAEIKSMYTTRGYFAQDDYVLKYCPSCGARMVNTDE